MSSAVTPKAFRANGTIRRARFVKIDTTDNNSVLEADANEKAFGITQVGGREAPIPSVTADPPQAAQSGDQVQVFTNGMACLLELGSGGCTAGDYLKSDADGKGVAIATTGTTLQRYGAVATESGSAGELVKVQVLVGSERPAIA